MTTSASTLDSDAIDVEATETALRIFLADGRELLAPIDWFPRLRDATAEQKANRRLIGGGEGVHWPDIDEDIAAASFEGRAG